MASRKLGDTTTLDFTTHNPSTGSVSDADALPTCEVFEDDNDTAILSPIVTKRIGKTGDYRLSIEATVGNGFDVGKTYNVIASATVNSTSAKSRVGIFVLDSKRNADMNDLSQLQILSDATPFQGSKIATLAGDVWDAVWVSHTISGSFGKLVRSIYKFILLK
jgi:hypothetical protein